MQLISVISPVLIIVKKYRPQIVLGIKILISAGLLTYITIAIDYNSIIVAIQQADVYLITAAVLLSIANVYLQFLKWKITCSKILFEKNNSKILSSLFHGFAGGIFTPMRVGEYFGRSISFKDKSFSIITIATLVDKFFPLLIVAFSGSISALIFIYFYFNISLYIVIALFIILFTAFYFLILLVINERFWDSMFFSRIKKIKKISAFIIQIRALKTLDRKFFFNMSILSLLFYTCYLIQFSILVSAFSHNYSFFNYAWAGVLMIFTKTVIPQISMGELGIREGASVYFLSQLGETSATAFNASIFLFLINLLLPSLVGFILMLKKSDG